MLDVAESDFWNLHSQHFLLGTEISVLLGLALLWPENDRGILQGFCLQEISQVTTITTLKWHLFS